MVKSLGFRQKRHRRQRHQQSVTVGLRSRRKGISNHAASSGAVVDHDRLTEKLLERLRHRACCEIGLSARRKWDNHSDVAQGPGLRRGRRKKGAIIGDAKVDPTSAPCRNLRRCISILPGVIFAFPRTGRFLRLWQVCSANDLFGRGAPRIRVLNSRIRAPSKTSVPRAVRPCPRGSRAPPAPRRARSGRCR